jgi:hypothetical protein
MSLSTTLEPDPLHRPDDLPSSIDPLQSPHHLVARDEASIVTTSDSEGGSTMPHCLSSGRRNVAGSRADGVERSTWP